MDICISLPTDKYAKLKKGESVLIFLSNPLLDDADMIGVKECFFDDKTFAIDCDVICLEPCKYILLPKVNIEEEKPIWVRECIKQKEAK